jgi:hypothetical protein
MHRILGISHICVGAVQAALYATITLGGHSLMWLFYLDPRIGWFMLETMIRQDQAVPGVTSWATAMLACVVGVILIRNPARIGVYLAAETIMALPTLGMFVLVVVQSMSPTHGFSIGELMIPIPIFIMVSVVPLTLGYRSRKPSDRSAFDTFRS